MYEVIVGNIGKVYSGLDYEHALGLFDQYVDASLAKEGRASGEPVTLMRDNDILMSYEIEDSQ